MSAFLNPGARFSRMNLESTRDPGLLAWVAGLFSTGR